MSADRLTEKRTDNPYYVALVRIDQKDLNELPQVRLYLGYAGDGDDPNG